MIAQCAADDGFNSLAWKLRMYIQSIIISSGNRRVKKMLKTYLYLQNKDAS
jgi:hypothetical protein